MNIVKENIDSIGGTIKVQSEPKIGAKFSIEIPLTLAIIKSLFIEAAEKLYAIPLVNIARLVTVRKEDIRGILNYEAVIFDEDEIPITRLDVLFGAPSSEHARQPIAIIRNGQELLGLIVQVYFVYYRRCQRSVSFDISRKNSIYFSG